MNHYSATGNQMENTHMQATVSGAQCVVDTHFHVFDNKHASKAIRPRAPASLAEYLAFRAELGITHSVIVAPSTYGKNNDCLLESLGELGSENNRGIIILDGKLTAEQLGTYHQLGVRGLRLYAGHGDLDDHDALYALAEIVAEQGWHLQLLGELDSEPFVALERVLSELPCTIVLDHFAFAPQPNATQSRTAATLRRLLDTGRTYVKLSGMYIQSLEGPPHYSDFDELAISLITQAPERMLWGSDWPHTLATVKPIGLDLMSRLEVWAPDPSVRNDILCSNPLRLYWDE